MKCVSEVNILGWFNNYYDSHLISDPSLTCKEVSDWSGKTKVIHT